MSLVLLEILLEAEKQTTVSYNRVQSLLPALLVGNGGCLQVWSLVYRTKQAVPVFVYELCLINAFAEVLHFTLN